jgi:hypothetical protein
MINLCLSTWGSYIWQNSSNKVTLVSDSSCLPLWPYLWIVSTVLFAIMPFQFLLVNCFYCTICHNAMPVSWWWGSLKTSRPPCFRPSWKKCVEKLLQYISFKQPSLKAVVPVSVPLAFRKNHEYMQLFWYWNIQIFVDVNSFSYYPREIVFELSRFLSIFQNVHQGYPTETLVRFLKAREWHVNKAHRMVIVNTAIVLFNFHIDEPLK